MEGTLPQLTELRNELREEVLPFVDIEEFPSIAHSLQLILNGMSNQTTRVVFNGLFSSGKSSVLNLLINRAILPQNEQRETGAPCVLASSPEDLLTVYRKNGLSQTLPLNLASIREQISLTYGLAETGKKRTDIEVEYVRIDLKDAPIPQNMVWVDAPGIDDPTTAQEARKELDRSDILAVVLHTASWDKKILQELIRNVWMHRTPGELVFIVNVSYNISLKNTPDQWKNLFETIYPERVAKIRAEFSQAGYPQVDQLRFFPITAWPNANFPDLDQYRQTILTYFQQLADRNQQVEAMRLSRASASIQILATQLIEQLEESDHKVFQKCWDQYQQTRQVVMEKHAGQVSQDISLLINQIDQTAARFKSQITAQSLQTTKSDVLSKQIRERIQADIDQAITSWTHKYLALLHTSFIETISDRRDYKQSLAAFQSPDRPEILNQRLEVVKSGLFEKYLHFPEARITIANEVKQIVENKIEWEEVGKRLVTVAVVAEGIYSIWKGRSFTRTSTLMTNPALQKQLNAHEFFDGSKVFTKKISYENDLQASVIRTKENIQKAADDIKEHIRTSKQHLMDQWKLEVFDSLGRQLYPTAFLSKITYHDFVKLIILTLLEKSSRAQLLALQVSGQSSTPGTGTSA